MSGSLERLAFTAYSDANFNTQVGKPFSAWINPATYKHDYAILYTDRQAPGAPGPSPEFNRVGPESVSFELVFDTTGVVPPPVPGTALPSDGVAGLISQFRTLFGTTNGSTHRPNYAKVSWAQLQFQGVLSQMNTVYSLFKPDGTPIRAKMSVTFLAFTSEVQLAKQANMASPDMTHLVTVVAGDTLPLLCHRIYGDSRYYISIAAYNGLSDFRRLRPGSQIVFPPLAGTAA
jgi:phage tail protein X